MSLNANAKRSSTEATIDFESGQLDEQATIEFFQDLIDSGQAWTLSDSYGRTAMSMIRSGQ
jgi:hypothetical protein